MSTMEGNWRRTVASAAPRRQTARTGDGGHFQGFAGTDALPEPLGRPAGLAQHARSAE
jgi:hypothetical protein